jgi:hypothetical protein
VARLLVDKGSIMDVGHEKGRSLLDVARSSYSKEDTNMLQKWSLSMGESCMY